MKEESKRKVMFLLLVPFFIPVIILILVCLTLEYKEDKNETTPYPEG